MDSSALVQLLASLALAAVTTAIPLVVPLLRKYLHVQISDTQASQIQAAAQAGAQLAYGEVVRTAGNIRIPATRNAALDAGVAHVIASAPDALTALGITPGHVRQMVAARLGGLLAVDPTISITENPSALAVIDRTATMPRPLFPTPPIAPPPEIPVELQP